MEQGTTPLSLLGSNPSGDYLARALTVRARAGRDTS